MEHPGSPCAQKLVLLVWVTFSVFSLSEQQTFYLGSFTSQHHGVTGDLYQMDNASLLLERFSYDGSGPDAVFYVGTAGSPSQQGKEIFQEEKAPNTQIRKYEAESCK